MPKHVLVSLEPQRSGMILLTPLAACAAAQLASLTAAA